MPTGRRGQLLALSLLFVALGGVYLLVASPLFGLYAERALLATMALIDGNSFDPPPQGTDGSNHQRIAGAQRRSAQFLRQQIRKLCAPPGKELA